jgi:hypothetical protein
MNDMSPPRRLAEITGADRTDTEIGVQRFFSEAGQRYERQRREIVEARSAWALARHNLINTFSVRLGELQHESREAVRKLDDEFEAAQARRERVLEALDSARLG